MAQSEDLRKRMEALNRGPLEPQDGNDAASAQEDLRRQMRKRLKADAPAQPQADAPATPAPSIIFHRDLPRRQPPGPSIEPFLGPHVDLEEALEGAGTLAPDESGGTIVERRLEGAEGNWDALCEALARTVAAADSGLRAQLDYIGVARPPRPEDFLFFDVETTGLTSSPLFLIGTMVWDGPGLITRQYFARDYSQERATVALFLQLAAGRKLLVSFNGKSFDQPYVRTRAAANRLPCRLDHDHLDLLHAGRRIWKGQLPDCRLQTLESCICGRVRRDDLPGHLIPDAYHAYVRTGNAAQMGRVIKHNFLDLVTMADLIARMPPQEAPPGDMTSTSSAS